MNRDCTNLPGKYQPGTLGDLRGQPAAVECLQSFVREAESGRPAAFCFHGPTGTGKTSAGKALAFDLGIPRDDAWMGGLAEIPSGKQDGEAVEQLLRSLQLRPLFGSGWKVAIINEADRMTPGAEAIWLDGLESLPRRSVIVFTTNSLAAISGRLASRCELVEFDGSPAVAADLHAFIRQVWRKETGKALRRIPEGLGVFDIAGGTLSFRLALQQIAPYARSGRPLPDRFQPPIVRDSDSVQQAAPRMAALKAVATRRARAAGGAA
jgi:replication-associated recombination protein RarA